MSGIKILTVFMTLYLVTSVSIAQPPRPNVYNDGNRWHITFFNDPTTIHQQWATQTLCFLPYSIVGTSIQGKWYSTTYPDWNGLYYQEGDEVKMTGDFWHDTGHDHMTLFHTTVEPKGMAFKDWTEWGEDDDYGFIFGWGNARLIRDGYCWLPHSGLNHLTAKTSAEIEEYEKEASELSKRLPQRLMRDGREAEFPGVPDQEDVATYLKRAGLGGPIQ